MRNLYWMLATAAFLSSATFTHSAELYVSPQGQEGAKASQGAPLKSIQAAIEIAQPGDTVHILAGLYLEDITTVRDGGVDAPITLVGDKDTIISGDGAARVVQIQHDYITLKGLTVDGHFLPTVDVKDAYREKLIYVMGKDVGNGVTGFKLSGVTLRNAGGECLRMRYGTTRSEISENHFERCGTWDFEFADGGKNGEAIYLGTAPEQLGEFGAPSAEPDGTDENWIHHNTFDTKGNECVDIKEGSTRNVVEYNRCTGQLDSESGGMDSRGSGNIFRYNEIFDNAGAGIRIGGDENSDGVNNELYGNILRNNAKGGIRLQRSPQAMVCENTFEQNGERPVAGTFGNLYPGGDPCDFQVATDTSTITNGQNDADRDITASQTGQMTIAQTPTVASGSPAEAAGSPPPTQTSPNSSLQMSPMPAVQSAPAHPLVAAIAPVAGNSATANGVDRIACPATKQQCVIGVFNPGQGLNVLYSTEPKLNGTTIGFADVITDDRAEMVNPANYAGTLIVIEYDRLTPGGLASPVLMVSLGKQ